MYSQCRFFAWLRGCKVLIGLVLGTKSPLRRFKSLFLRGGCVVIWSFAWLFSALCWYITCLYSRAEVLL